jgi:hypothetical protein
MRLHMPKTLRAVLAVLGAGVLLGIIARSVQGPSDAVIPIGDPPVAACAQQAWPNLDRRCLSWTVAPASEPVQTTDPSEQPGRRKPAAQEQRDMLGQLSVARPLPTELQGPAVRAHAREVDRESARAKMRRQRLAERRREARTRAAAYGFGGFDRSQVSSYAAEARPRSRIRPTSPQDAYYYSQRPSWQRPFSAVEPFSYRNR